MEIEYLARDSEVEKARKAIIDTLHDLGVTKDMIDNIGYTRRLHDKGIKDKKYFITKKLKDKK
jgi:hypothetical protein